MYLLKFIFILFVMTSETFGDIIFKDNFTNRENWKLITDQVMGGISTGEVKFINTKKSSYVNLKGNVSTKNRGGFIQIRNDLRNVSLDEAKYIHIQAKGNNQNYFLHIRTKGTILPWQYYQIDFKVNETFKVYKLAIENFKRSSSFISKKINPKNITSIAIVAFGRDHQASIFVQEIQFSN